MSGLPEPMLDAEHCTFEQLFEAYADRLCRFVDRYVKSWDEAEELVQEVFLTVWRRREELASVRSLDAYLYTFARNRALDHLKRRRVAERYRREHAPSAPDPAEQSSAALGDGLSVEEIEAAIQRAVDTLPRRQREVLLLRWREHLSYDAIAARLGIAPRTVAVHLQRAAERLRQLLPSLV